MHRAWEGSQVSTRAPEDQHKGIPEKLPKQPETGLGKLKSCRIQSGQGLLFKLCMHCNPFSRYPPLCLWYLNLKDGIRHLTSSAADQTLSWACLVLFGSKDNISHCENRWQSLWLVCSVITEASLCESSI